MKARDALTLLLSLLLIQMSSAVTLDLSSVFNFICTLKDGMFIIGTTIVLLMMVYGGVKYVYSADDPGGRKQALSTIINAFIGGIFLILAYTVITMITLPPGAASYGACGIY